MTDRLPENQPASMTDGSEKVKVLVVDDEADFAEMLALRLQEEGIDAHGLTSGDKAMAFLDANPVDVVLLDMMMPGMNGVDVVREMKKRRPFLEIIVLTGYPSPDSLEAVRLGAFDVLVKPTLSNEIVERVLEAHERSMIFKRRFESGNSRQGNGAPHDNRQDKSN